MRLLVCAALLLMGAAPADSVTDYIPDAWRERAQLEMSQESSRDANLKNERLDEGIAQLVLGPFETLDFIRSDEMDPRKTARLRVARFNVVRGDTCAGNVEVYESLPELGNPVYLKAMLMRMFSGPKSCGYDPVATARTMARTPRSICELILPLELAVWRVVLIDTRDGETLVMEFPTMPGQQIDSTAITITPLADWSAHTRTSLREWLRLDQPLPPVSHDVPDDALRATEAWLRGEEGQRAIARQMSVSRIYGRPSLGEPAVAFHLSELELVRYIESDEVDPTRFDVNPRYVVPVVVEDQELLYAFLKGNRDELGRGVPHSEGDYAIEYGDSRYQSEIRPPELLPYGHVAEVFIRALLPGRWYHILGPEGAWFTSFGWKGWAFIRAPDGTTRKGDGSAPEVVPLYVLAGWAKPEMADALRAWRASLDVLVR
ncbi:MAG: hypothetical protein OEY32_15010 [Candidatus Krumholzibacteria bacterium]|nr:hypothetical protein [Candidatus Krumholzibacteria bacterium]